MKNFWNFSATDNVCHAAFIPKNEMSLEKDMSHWVWHSWQLHARVLVPSVDVLNKPPLVV
jgi:hypothetical protein